MTSRKKTGLRKTYTNNSTRNPPAAPKIKDKPIVELNFIQSNGHLVDSWILKEALKGENFYINRALYQIHSRSLEECVAKNDAHPVDVCSQETTTFKSYKEVLLSKPDNSSIETIVKVKPYSRPQCHRSRYKVIFVSNIPTTVLAIDV